MQNLEKSKKKSIILDEVAPWPSGKAVDSDSTMR